MELPTRNPWIYARVLPTSDFQLQACCSGSSRRVLTASAQEKLMTVLANSLTDLESDVLREIANIGTGNAVTALNTMTGHSYSISVPTVGLHTLEEFGDVVGDPETLSLAVYMAVEGDVDGHAAFIFPYPSACELVDDLMGQPSGTTQEFDEIACSAIREVGNVLVSSFLNALSQMTEFSLPATLPGMAIDMAYAIIGSLAAASTDLGDSSLMIVTKLYDDNSPMKGVFVFIPEPHSLRKLFSALGI